MESKRIRTILFDLGNVLFDLDIPATEKALSKLLSDRTPAFKKWAENNQFFERFEIGEISNERFIEEIQQYCLVGTTDQEIIDGWNAMLLGMPEARLTWLKELRSQYCIALLSNTNGLHIDRVRSYFKQTQGLTNFEATFFDKVYYSHDIGARKPNKEAFQLVLEDLNMLGNEVLFIDDVIENTEQAARLGMHAQRHKPGTEIREHFTGYIQAVVG